MAPKTGLARQKTRLVTVIKDLLIQRKLLGNGGLSLFLGAHTQTERSYFPCFRSVTHANNPLLK